MAGDSGFLSWGSLDRSKSSGGWCGVTKWPWQKHTCVEKQPLAPSGLNLGVKKKAFQTDVPAVHKDTGWRGPGGVLSVPAEGKEACPGGFLPESKASVSRATDGRTDGGLVPTAAKKSQSSEKPRGNMQLAASTQDGAGGGEQRQNDSFYQAQPRTLPKASSSHGEDPCLSLLSRLLLPPPPLPRPPRPSAMLRRREKTKPMYALFARGAQPPSAFGGRRLYSVEPHTRLSTDTHTRTHAQTNTLSSQLDLRLLPGPLNLRPRLLGQTDRTFRNRETRG